MMLFLLIGCFLTVTAAVAGIGYWFLRRPENVDEARANAEIATLVRAPVVREELEAAPLTDTLKTIGEKFAAAQSPKNPFARKLLQAGYRHPAAPQIFYGAKCALAAAIALPLAVWGGVTGDGLSGALGAAVGGGGFAWFVPDRVLEWRVRRRQQNLKRALPPSLDLMVLGLEAGQGIDSVLADTAREFRRAYPEIAAEFASVAGEIKAGNTRVDVLRSLAYRNQEPELTKLINLLVDGDRFGTSLAPALRDHARYLRTRRRQEAQEQARKTSVKLVFPVFFLIFPSVLLVTLGPAVLTLMGSLSRLLQ